MIGTCFYKIITLLGWIRPVTWVCSMKYTWNSDFDKICMIDIVAMAFFRKYCLLDVVQVHRTLYACIDFIEHWRLVGYVLLARYFSFKRSFPVVIGIELDFTIQVRLLYRIMWRKLELFCFLASSNVPWLWCNVCRFCNSKFWIVQLTTIGHIVPNK